MAGGLRGPYAIQSGLTAGGQTREAHRLSEDLHAYIESLELVIPNLESHRRAVQHVSDSLAAGRILDGETALFEAGVFARLGSAELQTAVAELYAMQAKVEANFSWWRQKPIQLENTFQPYVEYYSVGPRVKSTDLRAEADEARAADAAVTKELAKRQETFTGVAWARSSRSTCRVFDTSAGQQVHEVEVQCRDTWSRRKNPDEHFSCGASPATS